MFGRIVYIIRFKVEAVRSGVVIVLLWSLRDPFLLLLLNSFSSVFCRKRSALWQPHQMSLIVMEGEEEYIYTSPWCKSNNTTSLLREFGNNSLFCRVSVVEKLGTVYTKWRILYFFFISYIWCSVGFWHLLLSLRFSLSISFVGRRVPLLFRLLLFCNFYFFLIRGDT